MKRNIIFKGTIFVAILTFTLFFYGCKQKDENTKTIGAILPLTGSSSTLGQWHKDGIDFFMYKSDSVQKKIYEVVYEDSKNEAKEGINAYRKLKATGVDMLFSAMSGVSVPLKAFASKDNIPMYVTSVSQPQFTSDNLKNIIRYNLTSDKESLLVLEEIFKRGKKGLNFYYIADEYGVGALEALEDEVKEKMPNFILYTQSYGVNTIDFASIVAKNNNDYPIYVAGYGNAYVGILKKIIETFNPDTLYTVYGMEFESFVKPLGEADVNIIYTRPRIEDYQGLEYFKQEFKQKYSYQANMVNIFSYDLMHYILTSLSNDNDKPIKSIYGYDLVLDQKGNLLVPLELNVINLKQENAKKDK